MKSFKFLSLLLISFLSVSLYSCGGDDENELETQKYKVRYEATLSDPQNFTLQVQYNKANDGQLLTYNVAESYSFEFEGEKGYSLVLGVTPKKKDSSYEGSTEATCRIYVDDVLVSENTHSIYAQASCILGF